MSTRRDVQGLAILGATGSIGRSALDVVRDSGGRFRVTALTGWGNVALLAEQAAEFRPDLVVPSPAGARELAARLSARGVSCRVLAGEEGLLAAAAHPDAGTLLAAIVGSAGLAPTVAGIDAGKRILLANKETLVVGGDLVTGRARARGVELVPVDSEHSALWQLLRAEPRGAVRRLVLTASGGPFRARPRETLAAVTVEEALAHPNWSMGAKISVDSATLMNKGLEVIEAVRLFDLPESAVDVVVHPQSIVHALVELVDGALLAHLGPTDMRLPIHYALHHPARAPQGMLPPLDLAAVGALTFERPRAEDFPCLDLARRAIRAGGTMPCVLNAANEAAVAAFLAGRIPFPGIARAIEAAMDGHRPEPVASVAKLLDLDAEVRSMVGAALGEAGAREVR